MRIVGKYYLLGQLKPEMSIKELESAVCWVNEEKLKHKDQKKALLLG